MKIPKPLVFNLAALAVVALMGRRLVDSQVLVDFALGWLVCLAVLAVAVVLRRFPVSRPLRRRPDSRNKERDRSSPAD